MNRKISVNLALAIAIIAMTVTFSVTMIVSQNMFDKTVSSVREKEIMYNKLAEIDKEVRAKYAGEINDATLLDYLGLGYIGGIGDPDAHYYTSKRYTEYLNEQSGLVVGVGVNIAKETGAYPRIIRVYSASPANEAGIVKGDILLKVGDYDCKSLTSEQVHNLLRGEAGTNVSLTVQTVTGEISQPLEMQRRQYESYTVEYEQRAGETIGYLRILTFTTTTADEVKKAIQKMQESEQGLSGLVIDVRNNTGGSLKEAMATIDVICPAGPIASQKDKSGKVELLQTSNAKQIDVPLVVLTNSATAAGAELFASSVRDFEMNAKVVGTSTAGKGYIYCEPVRMTDGSAISYRIGTLVTRKNATFDGTGIVPDMEAVLKPEDEKRTFELTIDTDTQILKGYEVLKTLMNQQPGGVVSAPIVSQSAASGSGFVSEPEVSSDGSADATSVSDISASEASSSEASSSEEPQ